MPSRPWDLHSDEPVRDPGDLAGAERREREAQEAEERRQREANEPAEDS